MTLWTYSFIVYRLLDREFIPKTEHLEVQFLVHQIICLPLIRGYSIVTIVILIL